MEGLEEKLSSILNDPKAMESIMSMAQSLSQNTTPVAAVPAKTDNPLSSIDPAMLQRLSGMAQQSSIDSNQQNLLYALGPYLNRERIHKLERAMRAAKLAKLASTFLNSGGLQLLTGR